MLEISNAAVPYLLALMQETRGEGTAFRVFVEKGGCAGLQYGMKLDVQRPGDEVSERGGARVVVDAQSLGYLKGAQLDYCEDLTGTGFRILNPNAARSCGCGTSFEPAALSATPPAGVSGEHADPQFTA